MDYNPGLYTPQFVQQEGVHCSGFINVLRMAVGLAPIGLTGAYGEYLWGNGGIPYDNDAPGIPGALVCKPWTPGTGPSAAEGHVALYVSEHQLIEATPYGGVVEGNYDYDVNNWADWEVYGLMPDVDYDGVDDYIAAAVPSPWLSPDDQGYMMVNGARWKSNGWCWMPESWHPPVH